MKNAAGRQGMSRSASTASIAKPSAGLSRRAHWASGEDFISVLMAKTLAHPELISLAAGFVDHPTLPVESVDEALRHLWSDPGRARAALQYGTTAGYTPLRAAILDRLLQADRRSAAELNLSPAQVVVTAGSNQLLYLVSDVLCEPGDIVLCASPSYFVYLGLLANLGVRAVGVETDQAGLIPEAVEEQISRLHAEGELPRLKAIYVTSYYDNPRGITLPQPRRPALLEIARRWSRAHRIYVIEDTAYRELRYRGDEVASIRSFDREGQTVICAGSFSKSFSPGIRVGWGILPEPLVEPVLAEKGNLDFGSPNFNQVLMATVLERGLYDPHIAGLRVSYRAKIDALSAAAEEFLSPLGGISWVRPSGGLYVWLHLPETVDTGLAGPLFERAVEEGVLYVPGEFCFAKEGCPRAKNTIRLSFGIQCCETIHRGIEALARALRQVL